MKFLSRGYGYNLFLTADEAVLQLRNADLGLQPKGRISGSPQPAFHTPQPTGSVVSLRLHLVGANPSPAIRGLQELPGKSNYLLGDDPARWRTNITTYRKVEYREVYPGVNLVYYGRGRQLEHDFVVAPGADPNVIRLAIEGADKLELDAGGDLVLHAGPGEVRFRKPVVYQETAGHRRPIPGGFVLRAPSRPSPSRNPQLGELGFQVGAYDPAVALVIDPTLVYSSYLGSTGGEYGYGIAVDAAGSAYVTGYTTSTKFPTASPLQTANGGGGYDAFVAKLNAGGSALAYSTYLGGSGDDISYGIAVDSGGNAYITGSTNSTNFPLAPKGGAMRAANAGGTDAFVAKLNSAGSGLVYSTYLGGKGDDFGYGIAVDSGGNAYVTGQTTSTDFPTASPLQGASGGAPDAFVAKLNSAGSALVYSTYLGGSNKDYGKGIAVDSAGNAYVTGGSFSTDFPTANPLQAAVGGSFDTFVAKLNAAGSALLYSTYLGGSGDDRGNGIAVDSAGSAYVTGYTSSTDFPTADPLQAASGGSADAFAAKLKADGSALIYCTYLGGGGYDSGTGIAVDSAGNAYLTGYTDSANFPTASPLQAAEGGYSDAFLAELNADGSALIFATYLGGSNWDFGSGIAVDSAGNAYVTGETWSTNFPTVTPMQAANGGSYDVFVAKVFTPYPAPTLVSLSPSSATAGGTAFTLTANGGNFVAGSVVRWNGVDRNTSFVSSTQLTASILATDIATAGTAQVSVFTPPPGGGLAAPLSFTTTSSLAPALNPGGLVNAASFVPGAVAPGTLASVFGANLGTLAQASGTPLPTTLGGAAATLNCLGLTGSSSVSCLTFPAVPVPLMFVSPTQINLQMPWEGASWQTPLQHVALTVSAGGLSGYLDLSGSGSTPPNWAPLPAFSPGIFCTNQSGRGQGAILISGSGGAVAAPAGMFAGSRPVRRGEFLEIYATGLGAVTNQPPSGTAAASNPLSTTLTTPTVAVGGVPAPVAFSGLAPGFVGLYQVNVQVPNNAPTADAVSVVLAIGGVTSNTVTVAVQ